MFKFLLKKFAPFFLCLFSMVIPAKAQVTVQISDTAKQQIFRYDKISYLKDVHSNLTINQVKEPAFANKFKINKDATPATHDPNSTWWFRIRIGYDPQSKNNWILEFFDQTIDSITVYAPDK